MNHHTVIGIDLAKTVFQVASLKNNKLVSNKQYKRQRLKELITNHAPCTIAMEACYSAHYWARECEKAGHQVKLIPAQHLGRQSACQVSLGIAE